MPDRTPLTSATEGFLSGADQKVLHASALLVGERLDYRRFEKSRGVLATTPLTINLGRIGSAVLFRYGVVVVFDVTTEEEALFLDSLKSFVTDPVDPVEREDAKILLAPGAQEQIDLSGDIVLSEITPERLQVVADVLAKSLVLEEYEKKVAAVFDSIEPLAESLRRRGEGEFRIRGLLRHTGDILLTQHRMVGRVEVLEKPEVLWASPALENLYLRLSREYELKDRHHALERKLGLISDTVETALDLVLAKRSLRVEWFIVILIIFEILLTLYEMGGQHGLW